MQRIHDDDETYVQPKEMLKRLMEDNKEFAHNMRVAHKICDANNDIATASLLENYVDEAERRIWFLYETISD